MRILALWSAIAMLFLPVNVRAMASLGVSKDMRQIVEILKGGSYGLDVTGMPKAPEAEAQKAVEKPGIEVYKFPRDKRQDAFVYTIYYNKATREYWVWETGGVAMVSRYYGPVKLPVSE